MTIDVLLAKLDGVRRTGVDRGIAKCPAHEDGRASLSWRELPDGRTLLHCFAGCSVQDVLAAVGSTFDDLFPEKPSTSDFVKREKKPWTDRQLLELIDRETVVVFIAAADVTLEGRKLNEVDMSRLRKARERITAIMGALS